MTPHPGRDTLYPAVCSESSERCRTPLMNQMPGFTPACLWLAPRSWVLFEPHVDANSKGRKGHTVSPPPQTLQPEPPAQCHPQSARQAPGFFGFYHIAPSMKGRCPWLPPSWSQQVDQGHDSSRHLVPSMVTHNHVTCVSTAAGQPPPPQAGVQVAPAQYGFT